MLARHPDLADDLTRFLDNREWLGQLGEPVRAGGTQTLPADEQRPAPAEAAGLPTVRYFGDYELLEEIARGGMGVVYKARQVSLNRVVALKMILAGQLAGQADVQRFRPEAEAAANLDHPNIVPIYEVGEHEGQHYFSMKLIEGGSLARSRPELVGRPAAGRAAAGDRGAGRSTTPTSAASCTATSSRPTSCSTPTGEPHVTDFGLAKRVERRRAL